jgi:cation diffusion facilitator CzcD-associated flavoprotein CzcO
MEKFKGRIVHTAQWPDDFGPTQWESQNIAIIGTGASSVQTTPG